MTDRYKPNGVPLTAYEREILEILQEECAEVIVAASKLLRFGKENRPDTGKSNTTSLELEIGDVNAMIDLAVEAGIVGREIIGVGYQRKIDRLKHYMQTDAPVDVRELALKMVPSLTKLMADGDPFVDKLAERNRG